MATGMWNQCIRGDENRSFSYIKEFNLTPGLHSLDSYVLGHATMTRLITARFQWYKLFQLSMNTPSVTCINMIILYACWQIIDDMTYRRIQSSQERYSIDLLHHTDIYDYTSTTIFLWISILPTTYNDETTQIIHWE